MPHALLIRDKKPKAGTYYYPLQLQLAPGPTPGPNEILDPVVHIVSEGIALALFGPPLCDEPEVVRLCSEHTKNSE